MWHGVRPATTSRGDPDHSPGQRNRRATAKPMPATFARKWQAACDESVDAHGSTANGLVDPNPFFILHPSSLIPYKARRSSRRQAPSQSIGGRIRERRETRQSAGVPRRDDRGGGRRSHDRAVHRVRQARPAGAERPHRRRHDRLRRPLAQTTTSHVFENNKRITFGPVCDVDRNRRDLAAKKILADSQATRRDLQRLPRPLRTQRRRRGHRRHARPLARARTRTTRWNAARTSTARSR